jgi:gamma-polyglutamate biosynthesis protein CapA
MRGPTHFAECLRRIGFNVLNVANNHAMQHGLVAFTETVEHAQRAGIAVCGLRGTQPWTCQPTTFTANGIRLGILGYCLRPRQYGDDNPPFAEGTPEQIIADVRLLKTEVDHVIVSLHWGEEFVSHPSDSEAAFARSLVDQGATMVVGHHPHVLRPIEQYHSGVIAYSLGNCVSDMIWQSGLRKGALLLCDLSSNKVESAQYVRTFVNRGYSPNPTGGVLPVPRGFANALADEGYKREVKRKLNAQRLAAYRYALVNLWRYPPRMLAQLVGQTLSNKLRAVRGLPA